MINLYYFTDTVLQFGFNITPESHHINHANSKIIAKPNDPEFAIEIRYINEIIKELSVICARLINQKKSKIKQFSQQDLINRMKIIKF